MTKQFKKPPAASTASHRSNVSNFLNLQFKLHPPTGASPHQLQGSIGSNQCPRELRNETTIQCHPSRGSASNILEAKAVRACVGQDTLQVFNPKGWSPRMARLRARPRQNPMAGRPLRVIGDSSTSATENVA